MKNMLFVDDDAKLLATVKRNTRTYKTSWQVSFEGNPFQALELLKKYHYDVLVTDIRMPLMNGAQLLDAAASISPLMMRIGTSGHFDPLTTYSMTHQPHYFLAKPFTTETLIDFVQSRYQNHNIEIRKAKSWLEYISRHPGRPEANDLPKPLRSQINRERLRNLGISFPD